MIAGSINIKIFDFVACSLFRFDWLRCLMARGETDSAFRSRIALHDQARFYCPRSGRSDSDRYLGYQLSSNVSNAEKIFAYGKEWNGKVYTTKQVRPIFVEEASVPQAEFTERSRRQ